VAGPQGSLTGPGDDLAGPGADWTAPGSPTQDAPGASRQDLDDWTALAGLVREPGRAGPPGATDLGWRAQHEITPVGPSVQSDEPAEDVTEADDLRAWSGLVGRGGTRRGRQARWEEPGYEPATPADDPTEPGLLGQPGAEPTMLFDEEGSGPGGSWPPAEPGWAGSPPDDPGRLASPIPAPDLRATQGEANQDPVEPPEDDYPPPRSRRIRIGRQSPSASPLLASGDRRQDMGVRLATGLGALILTLGLFKVGPLPSFVLALVVVVLAAAEGFAVLHQAGYRPATLLGLTATASLMIATYLKGETAVPLIFALLVSFTLLWYLAGVVRARPTVNVAITWLGFLWVGFLGSFASLLLNPRIFPNRHGVAFLLGALLAVVGHDAGAWVIGSRFGRHPLVPAISPNKTWEGLIGGMVSAILVSVIVTSQVHPWNFGRAAALGLVVAVVAPLGDLCESMIKRDIGIKDMGSLLPGHGGMLDRIDALLFVLPATYYLVRLLKIG